MISNKEYFIGFKFVNPDKVNMTIIFYFYCICHSKIIITFLHSISYYKKGPFYILLHNNAIVVPSHVPILIFLAPIYNVVIQHVITKMSLQPIYLDIDGLIISQYFNVTNIRKLVYKLIY